MSMTNTRSGTGEYCVAWKELADAREVRNDLGNVKNHVIGFGVLANLAIDRAGEAKIITT